MELLSVRALRGPSLWSDSTLLDVTICTELGIDADPLPEDVVPLLSHPLDAVRARDPGLVCARVLADLIVGLQRRAGSPVEVAEVHANGARDQYRLYVGYREEAVGRLALDLALRLIAPSSKKGETDVASAVDQLRELDQDRRLGPSTGSIVRAAEARGIPVRRLTEGSLVQLGQGARIRRIWAAETDETSAVAEAIAQDKELTKSLLAAAGVPVPEGRTVASADEAWQAALELGVPVVVKPRNGNQGRGVSVNLEARNAVEAAFVAARKESSDILVERFVRGADHRLLVIGNQLVAAARREVPAVVGDGVQTVAELVEIINQDPRRSEGHATALSTLKLDTIGLEVLAAQGLGLDSVPARGERVVLRRNANLSTGGSAVDVTDEVHPEVRARVVEAAKVIGLDIAGIDVVASCLDRPLEQSGGAIVEVNAAPGLRMHLAPSVGQPRPVGEAIVDMMFLPGDTARIPVVSVTGTNGKTTTVRCIAHLLRGLGYKVGMTCTDGIYVDDHRIDTGDCSGPRSARTVLSHPQVQAAVLETARGGILREGLGFDWCDVAVVTNIGEGDHLGMGGVETPEELARVKQTTVRRVSPRGAAVLNACDPLVVAMADHCPGAVIYFSREPDHSVLVLHRQQGGRVVFVRDGWVCAARGREQWQIASLERLPLTHGGRIAFQIDNLLAAAAAAWFLGVPLDLLRMRLEGFMSDTETVPGRFNVVASNGSTVILDYGHNASALRALVDAIQNLPHLRRCIVYTAAGDRRDQDIIRQARIIGDGFDQVFLYEDQCTRGRPDGEVVRLMREGLRGTTRAQAVHETRGELVAIRAALEDLQPGDLLLCQVDQVELALGFVRHELERMARHKKHGKSGSSRRDTSRTRHPIPQWRAVPQPPQS